MAWTENRISLRVKQVAGTGTSSHEDRVEMEQLVYEEYDTEEHEVLAIVLKSQSATVGVSLLLSHREVEYNWARFPDFCSCEELCDGGGRLGREVDPGLVCQHPLPGRGSGQEHRHQAYRALEVRQMKRIT